MKIKILAFVAFSFLLGYLDAQAATSTSRTTPSMSRGFSGSPSKSTSPSKPATTSTYKYSETKTPVMSYSTPTPKPSVSTSTVTPKATSGFGSFGTTRTATTTASTTFTKPAAPVASSFTGDLRSQASKDAALRTLNARSNLKTAAVATAVVAPVAVAAYTAPTAPTYRYAGNAQPQRATTNTTVINNYHTAPTNSSNSDWIAPAALGYVVGSTLAQRDNSPTVVYRDAPPQETVVYRDAPAQADYLVPSAPAPAPVATPTDKAEESSSHWFLWTMFFAFSAAGIYWFVANRKTVKPNYSF